MRPASSSVIYILYCKSFKKTYHRKKITQKGYRTNERDQYRDNLEIRYSGTVLIGNTVNVHRIKVKPVRFKYAVAIIHLETVTPQHIK